MWNLCALWCLWIKGINFLICPLQLGLSPLIFYEEYIPQRERFPTNTLPSNNLPRPRLCTLHREDTGFGFKLACSQNECRVYVVQVLICFLGKFYLYTSIKRLVISQSHQIRFLQWITDHFQMLMEIDTLHLSARWKLGMLEREQGCGRGMWLWKWMGRMWSMRILKRWWH